MATQQPQQNAPKGKRYRTLTPVDLDNKRYEAGKTLPEIDDEIAAPLLAVNAIELAGKSADAE